MKPQRGYTFFLIFFLALIIGFIFGFRIINQETKYPTVTINEKAITIEIADTQEKKNQGLSGRDQLLPNHGMLFIFEKNGNYSFWMDKMKFNLDFVFIAGSHL